MQREGLAVVPAGNVPCIGLVEKACVGDPTEYASVHLLLHPGYIGRGQRRRFGQAYLCVVSTANTPSITRQWSSTWAERLPAILSCHRR